MGITNWFKGRTCPICGSPLATNGREDWCTKCDYVQRKKSCKKPWGQRTAHDRDNKENYEDSDVRYRND